MKQPSRRVAAFALVVLLIAALVALTGGHARAYADSPSWQFAPAQAPPPPAGTSPSQFPAALGQVGDIEFWAPNEGLLITGGTEADGGIVPAGLYAYDGVSWHLLSDVCGSAEGRIAYASADEWWTISDQRPGLALPGSVQGTSIYDAISLCHFVDGVVVASYALPVDEVGSWPQMHAAACDGPDDCWFAGGDSSTTGGAFHLYWNGSTLTEVDNTAYPQSISSIAVDDGQLYEAPTLSASGDPTAIEAIEPANLSDPFANVVLRNFQCTGLCPVLPVYGGTAGPSSLSAFELSSDAGSVGDPASPGQLWAAATPTGSNAQTTVLRYTDADSNWNQIIGSGDLGLPAGETLEGGGDDGNDQDIAAVPGQDAAWLALGSTSDGAGVQELTGSSSGSSETWSLSSVDDLGPAQELGDLGSAGPIVCPAANDCWLATSEGWLFNWTDGTSYGQSSDPVYNGGDGVISYRPPDDGTPNVPGTTPPPDDSLANQAPSQVVLVAGPATPPKKIALVEDEKASLIKGTDTLQFTFKLAAKAKVQLLASRREKTGGKTARTSKAKTTLVVVARSKQQTLGKGKHSIELKLNPKRWPTSLELDATQVKAKT